MRRNWLVLAVAVILPSLPVDATAGNGPHSSRSASLMTVEGVVRAVETIPAETGGETLLVRLEVDEPAPREIQVMLAPQETLRQSGFEVEAGDRLRARVFLAAEQPFDAHKLLNLSRGMMIRLRTLRQVPLWNGDGQWQGGPCRRGGGPPGTGGRHHGHSRHGNR